MKRKSGLGAGRPLLMAALVALSLGLLVLPYAGPDARAEGSKGTEPEGKLKEILNRGKIRVGVNLANPPGLFSWDESIPGARPTGLEADLACALAAALFGDKDAWDPIRTNPRTRFELLQSGDLDVTIRFATWTLGRDAYLILGNGTEIGGFEFPFIYLYDGGGILAPKPCRTVADLQGKKIFVFGGTTTESALLDLQTKLNAEHGLPAGENFFEVDSSITSFGGLIAAVSSNGNHGAASDKSALNFVRSALSDPSNYNIIEDLDMSKEPLSVVVTDDQEDGGQWLESVRWVLLSLVEAEEKGVTQANVHALAASSSDPSIRRFLGSQGNLGTLLGLDNECFRNAIGAVGNYGECFDRNLGPGSGAETPRGLNNLWTNGGLMYSPPFR